MARPRSFAWRYAAAIVAVALAIALRRALDPILGAELPVICLFPVVVNVATGLATTEPELEDVLRSLGASKLDILRRVGLPRSMPYFFASLKIAVSLAFVGTVVAETVAANIGIGSMMILASSTFDVPLVFAGVFLLAVLGVAMYAVFALIERRVTFWARRNADVAV